MTDVSDVNSTIEENWLSICIPTYNRPSQLERMLETLIPQLVPGVEIIIRDDSEDQKTKAVIEEKLSQDTLNYQYFSGPRIGVDSAAIFLLEKASGEYIWWFSDDDEMSSDAIEKVREIILGSDYSALWANFSYDSNGSLAVDRLSGPFASPDDALVTLGPNVGLISTQIIKREIGIRAVEFAKNHVHGFAFASTAIFLKSLGEGRSYFLKGPVIRCNPTEIDEIKQITSLNGEINNNGFRVYGEYFRNLIIDLPQPYSEKAKRLAVSINFASLWRGILVGWVGGWDTPKGKRLRMLKLYWSHPECWIALPLFCQPRPIITALYKTYKIFYSHRKFVLIDRLRDLSGR